MAKGFRRTRRGVSAKLDEGERLLLAHLFVEVWELLGEGDGESDGAGGAGGAGGDGGGGGDGGDRKAGGVDPLEALLGIGTSTTAPSDPALARLLPSAHREDDEVAGEFRRYTEQGIRSRKRAGLETARQTLGREGSLELTPAEAAAWVIALTDVRLVVGERLGLRTDDDALALSDEVADSIEPDVHEGHGEHEGHDDDPVDPRVFLVAVYDFLTWLQETLVQAITR